MTLNVKKNKIGLVVEDDGLFREVLCKLLSDRLGLLPIEIEDGVATLQFLKLNWHRVGLVVCDILMPGIDGISLLEVCRGHEHYHRLPFVMITSSDSSAFEERAQALNIRAYIHKKDTDLFELEKRLAESLK